MEYADLIHEVWLHIAKKTFVLERSPIGLRPVNRLLRLSSLRLSETVWTVALFCSAPGVVKTEFGVTACIRLRDS